jgi:hypothetical protein
VVTAAAATTKTAGLMVLSHCFCLWVCHTASASAAAAPPYPLPPVTPMQFAFPFNSPVDLSKYPDYTRYIQTPMDFGTMRSKAEAGQYSEPGTVAADALLVFNNARTYNQPTEDVHYMASVLQVCVVCAGMQTFAAAAGY